MQISSRIPAALCAATLVVGAASAQIGTTYCNANQNSTGSISLISAAGSTDVALNSVTLACASLPTNSVGYFITSQTQGFVANPNGSSGNLCIVGNIGRYAGNILSSGATGSVSLPIDLTSMPAPMGSYAVMPGDTVNFQFWHRDGSPMGPTSNFSEGLEITFDVAGPTFSQDVWPLFLAPSVGMGPSCFDCHMTGFGTLFMTDVNNAYANLVNQTSASPNCMGSIYVIPGDATQSLLYEKMLPNPSCGAQMPFFNTFAGDPNVIRDWILAGAPF